ncbi:hypothetical protein SCHPADRAFT_159932 [Schizopora paradoxa]|uniref:Uncharacterized protein n=1 Tax=Schizopora paradoxa TaxID=27342 RepID=A0A0H2S0P0_9AGAM|nr:hypothetical protein SCHPADRAFT_159932 [Schizopora paradoxa]
MERQTYERDRVKSHASQSAVSLRGSSHPERIDGCLHTFKCGWCASGLTTRTGALAVSTVVLIFTQNYGCH